MMATRRGTEPDIQDELRRSEQERLIEQLTRRNAELENTNRLLLRQIEESRRAESESHRK